MIANQANARYPSAGAAREASRIAIPRPVRGTQVLCFEGTADCLTWSAPGCPREVLYRINGGGHCWPGGPQNLPAFIVGRAARRLDATAILFDFARGAESSSR